MKYLPFPMNEHKFNNQIYGKVYIIERKEIPLKMGTILITLNYIRWKVPVL